jgi:predicted Rossmann fold nucleotide-binding protein DprA/Smf involved in DNA uptake
MASVSGAVDEAAAILKSRISDLEEELGKLQRALSHLTEGRQGRRGPGRPRGSRTAATRTTGTRRRRRRGGTRADQAVRLIEQSPGISASEIAKSMRIKPNYMYRVLADLQKEGRVKKDGRKYTAA